MLQCYAIKDNQLGVFIGVPFFVKTLIEAQRAVAELVNDQRSNLGKYPEHMSLFQVASFDEVSGEVPHLGGPVFIQNLVEFKKGGV